MPSTDWHEPQEWLEGEKLTAQEMIEQLKDNLTFLFEKNFDVVQVSGVSDYQTTSTTVTPVSNTLVLTIRKYDIDTLVRLALNASVYSGTASAFIYFDVWIDGTYYASSGTSTPAAAGLVRYQQDTASVVAQLSLEAYIPDIDEGQHTFVLVWWVSAGTGTINVTNTIAQFSAEEYGVANVNIV
jgi:hypothetical protein